MKRLFAFAAFLFVPAWLIAQSSGLPQVELSADNMGPRSIEELTTKSIARDYAFAWQTMAQALDQSQLGLLDGYFTGFAKTNLSELVKQQKQSGVHVRYVDHGHKLEGLFYSPNGDAMQLRDRAELEIQILDGDKVVSSEQVHRIYLVLMTPGADRWLVRGLESIPGA